jgi:hypothetical protein
MHLTFYSTAVCTLFIILLTSETIRAAPYETEDTYNAFMREIEYRKEEDGMLWTRENEDMLRLDFIIEGFKPTQNYLLMDLDNTITQYGINKDGGKGRFPDSYRYLNEHVKDTIIKYATVGDGFPENISREAVEFRVAKHYNIIIVTNQAALGYTEIPENRMALLRWRYNCEQLCRDVRLVFIYC